LYRAVEVYCIIVDRTKLVVGDSQAIDRICRKKVESG
jgi:hypothetical protein